jgi:hypothetical protein
MGHIAGTCKAMGFKLARRKPFDPTEAMASLAESWTTSMVALRRAMG